MAEYLTTVPQLHSLARSRRPRPARALLDPTPDRRDHRPAVGVGLLITAYGLLVGAGFLVIHLIAWAVRS